MASSRYSVEFFCEPPAEDFLCSICTDVFDKPKVLPCRHTFCSVCIRRTGETSAGKTLMCPLCRKVFKMSDLKKPQINFQSLLNSLVMKCQNGPCGVQVTLEDYWKHHESCEFGYVYCIFENCGKKSLRKDLQNHLAECEYRHVPCREGCGEVIQYTDFKHHFYNNCRLGKRICGRCRGEYRYRERDQHDCIVHLIGKIESLEENMKSMSTGVNPNKGNQGNASTLRPPKSARLKTSFSAKITGDQKRVESRDILLLPGNFILFTDWNNKCLKQFDKKGGFISKMQTEDGACKLAHLANDKVALLNREAKTLEILKVSSRGITKEKSSKVKKIYYSIEALDKHTIAAVIFSQEDADMDILTLDGQVLRSLATSSPVQYVSRCAFGSLMCTSIDEKYTSVLKINTTSGAETLKKSVAGAGELFDIDTTQDNSCVVCDRDKKIIYLLDADGNKIRDLWSVPAGDDSGELDFLSLLDDVVVCCTQGRVFVLELLY